MSELDLVSGYPGQWIFADQYLLFTSASKQEFCTHGTFGYRCFLADEHQMAHWTEWTNWFLNC